MKYIGYFLFRLLVFIFSILPFSALYFLSDCVSFLMYYFKIYRFELTQNNLRKSFPNATKTEIEVIQRKFYHRLSDIILESLKGLSMSFEEIDKRITIEGIDVLEKYSQKNQSVIALAAHFNNWEWGGVKLPKNLPSSVITLVRNVNNTLISNYFNTLRGRMGTAIYSEKQSLRAFSKHKNEVSTYILVADQNPPFAALSYWIDFLHQPTAFLTGPEKLSRKYKYPVLYISVKRNQKRGHYIYSFIELCAFPNELKEGEVMQLFANQLAQEIYEEPEGWMWSHHRWKHKRIL